MFLSQLSVDAVGLAEQAQRDERAFILRLGWAESLSGRTVGFWDDQEGVSGLHKGSSGRNWRGKGIKWNRVKGGVGDTQWVEVKDEAGKVAPSRKVLNTKQKVFILLANEGFSKQQWVENWIRQVQTEKKY